MNRVFLAGAAALAALTTMTAANATDLPRRHQMPAKAPAYVTPLYNWSGFYAGINGGYGFGRSEWSAATGASTFDTSGGLVGGTAGYNYQMGQWVLGLEGDIDWSDLKGSTTAAPCTTTSCETRNSWLATARGRLGYSVGRLLPFVTAGGAFGDIKATPTGFAGERDTKAGWTVGGGVEVALTGPWTAKVEYLYVDLGKTTCAAGNCALPSNVDLTANIVRAGINYRF
jgi:outer membrane immunogenic protein